MEATFGVGFRVFQHAHKGDDPTSCSPPTLLHDGADAPSKLPVEISACRLPARSCSLCQAILASLSATTL